MMLPSIQFSIIARFVQGVADGILNVTLFSVVSIEWPENNEVYQGFMQLALGFGLLMGPVISTIVARWFKYIGTLFFFAVVILIIGLICSAILPERLNDKD